MRRRAAACERFISELAYAPATRPADLPTSLSSAYGSGITGKVFNVVAAIPAWKAVAAEVPETSS